MKRIRIRIRTSAICYTNPRPEALLDACGIRIAIYPNGLEIVSHTDLLGASNGKSGGGGGSASASSNPISSIPSSSSTPFLASSSADRILEVEGLGNAGAIRKCSTGGLCVTELASARPSFVIAATFREPSRKFPFVGVVDFEVSLFQSVGRFKGAGPVEEKPNNASGVTLIDPLSSFCGIGNASASARLISSSLSLTSVTATG
ncbi:hypothetical protein BKA63DRAFT_592889 [Paraphoma chrysanthemicola]|nr:hypothetical protein BKA63DRAFT_592889 [Paraphoma chrysanthemicola]